LLTRRAVLGSLFKGAGWLALRSAASAEDRTRIVLRRGTIAPVPIPDDFIGLGYEMSSVSAPGLLGAANSKYVALVNGLGARGVIRVGGIVADCTRFDAKGTAAWDPHHTVINEASLRQFAEFLDATGWRAIWSLNFAQGTLDDAVTEARAVNAALGEHLIAFELGNEVENYPRGAHAFRPPGWDYAAFRRQYSAWRAAIVKALPNARFAAPDTASSVEWVENMARDADGEVQLLTTHYYREYQKRGSAEQLLTPDPRLADVLARLRIASQQSHIPWRMCETNSFSGGGLPGVSDTLIGALWTLDFLLLLAAAGCSGVNIETGVNQLGFLSYYSPIRNDSSGAPSAGNPYYGMLAFAEARRGCTHMLPIEADLGGVNATAYALGASGALHSVVVVNRERAREAAVDLSRIFLRDAHVLRLTAPSTESTAQVTLGGASVDAAGRWSPVSTEKLRAGILIVPAMSAAVALAARSRA